VPSVNNKVAIARKVHFKFRKVGVLSSGEMRWRCTVKSYRATCYTIRAEKLGCREHESINACQWKMEKLKHIGMLCSAVRRKAVADLCEKPMKLIKQDILSSEVISTENLQLWMSVRRNKYTARKKVLPSLPKSLDEVQTVLDEINSKTIKSEHFLIAKDKVCKILYTYIIIISRDLASLWQMHFYLNNGQIFYSLYV
jgi:hypothetical protein